MTYREIFKRFLKQNSTLKVADYRPCCKLFDVPTMDNAIVIWLQDGTKIIYQISDCDDSCNYNKRELIRVALNADKERKYCMELKDTIEKMTSADYKERFIAEYQQTKIRYEKLKYFCDRIEVAVMTGGEEPKHDCPLSLLRNQQSAMGQYLHTLEMRAIIEGIDLRA